MASTLFKTPQKIKNMSNKKQNSQFCQTAIRRSHLRYCLMEAGLGCNEDRHPQMVMKELGITYQHSTPQSIGDQWWFWNCENIPEIMPSYLTPLNLNPMECIGYGLSKEDAESIRDYA